MPNGEYEIDESTFKNMPIEDQNWIQFTTFNKYRSDINTRLCKLEDRKNINTVISGVTGLVGGFLAMSGKWIVSKF